MKGLHKDDKLIDQLNDYQFLQYDSAVCKELLFNHFSRIHREMRTISFDHN